jgi:hypothetical protein
VVLVVLRQLISLAYAIPTPARYTSFSKRFIQSGKGFNVSGGTVPTF